jgi:hypothetical protein
VVERGTSADNQTLLTIATNIHNSSDPKYRSIKGDNGLLKRKVMGVIGGRDFMILVSG